MPPANPMPTVAQILGQMRRPGGLSPPAAPAAAATARRPATPPGPANLLSMLGPLLAGAAGSAPAPTPGPYPPAAMPAMAQPTPSVAPATAAALERTLARALDDPGSGEKPVYLSADDLAGLGADAPTLEAVLARMGLSAAPSFDGQGGALIARSPDLLDTAERTRDKGRPVVVIPAMSAGTPAQKY